MGNSDNSSAAGGIGFVGALTILFIALKLIPNGHGGTIIDWSWWLVLSPLWISALITVFIILFVVITAIVLSMRKR